MKKEWFVLSALTGQENKVLKSIKARTRLEGMEEYIGKCVIPTERVTEKRDGKTHSFTRKFFPGYVLCELALYDDTRAADPITRKRPIVERVWQFLRETPGCIGFVGGGNNPIPLSAAELDAIMSSGKGPRGAAPVPKVLFNVGDLVKVNEGPFMGLTGTVTMVDPDKGKLKVEVSIFSRKVQVDVEAWQVSKVSVEEMVAEGSAL